ncbi:MAG: carbon-nitrogen family hydrolase [Christensenella sp.]|nr:carbon-nitrogen family hydrolase [Christensenella sp.]
MIISCVQMNVAAGRPEQNFTRAEALVRKAARRKPDVIVLPETWNTGFAPRTINPAQADEGGARTKALFSALARELNVNIVAGSVVTRRSGRLYNTALVFSRTGECVAEYDKTHLFTPAGEGETFAAGDHLAWFTLDGAPCAIILCYEIRFPELVRSLALERMDILFVAAQWPKIRSRQLACLLRARAIENQCYAVLCNGCGVADGVRFGGGSVIADPLGESLAAAGGSERILRAALEIAALEPLRTALPVFSDRRLELYGNACRIDQRLR